MKGGKPENPGSRCNLEDHDLGCAMKEDGVIQEDFHMSGNGLTYYEDEINEDVFKNNGCSTYIQLMEKYLKEGKYFQQNGKIREEPPYNDPDAAGRKNWILNVGG